MIEYRHLYEVASGPANRHQIACISSFVVFQAVIHIKSDYDRSEMDFGVAAKAKPVTKQNRGRVNGVLVRGWKRTESIIKEPFPVTVDK